ncbi:chemotaxis protein CheW [bacterium]|nr:chemotaxis protein CheW [bacterium]
MISGKIKTQQKTLEKAVILDDKMKQSILKDARNLSTESLSLIKSVESYAFPAEGQFNLEEYGQFLFNRNLQTFFENLRLLGNKVHGLKGSCGFLVPQAKMLCHKIEDITRPLSEQRLILTRDISYLLKQTIFKIQDILDLFQENPDAEVSVDDWMESISQALDRGKHFIANHQEVYSRFIMERSVDHGEIRQRRTEEYLSVSVNGYELLVEQTKDLYYSLADERAIQASSLYNQLLQTHQEIKKVPMDLSRYERLIPNLAKEYGKEAELLIEDHQVRADHEFWNATHEILNHVLKNAVIHGLEKPEERKALGKESVGKIAIKLSEDALHILLSISDDGRGINTDRIVEKALSNSIITREQLEKMSEKEILDLLFVQGVSTAESLDDNAGRGVGMNAVQEAMHHFQGNCRIITEKGKGCSYHFSFAKSNVSLLCIIISIEDLHFAIPEDNVESFINYQKDSSFMVKQQKSYRYNGSAVPLIDFKAVFEINTQEMKGNQKQLIILKSAEGKTGLAIDDILHHAVMPILPLPRIYRQTPIYLGITIFKDTPVQVVDVEKLI